MVRSWYHHLRYLHHYQNQQPQPRETLLAAEMLLLPVFFPSLFAPLGHASPSIFSNAPKPQHLSRLDGALLRQSSVEEVQAELWSPLEPQGWKPCLISASYSVMPTGYIQVFLDDGLSQQRIGVSIPCIAAGPAILKISDAVSVPKILNATLIIPHLEVNPVWKDSR